ncbi:hypothetical protein [Methylobacterium sp. SI9]|uniref:hypothetical protein n=1 Tax=Methylobacterium guangdongense TaxID=3138811 RepID=UPI00313E3461
MISEKAFRKWQKRQSAIEEQEQARARADIGAEIDAALVEIRRIREREETQARFLHARRHETAIRQLGQPQPGLTEAQKRERHAEIRRGVERDVAAFEAERQQLGDAIGRR